jgi:hypothetical protein
MNVVYVGIENVHAYDLHFLCPSEHWISVPYYAATRWNNKCKPIWSRNVFHHRSLHWTTLLCSSTSVEGKAASTGRVPHVLYLEANISLCASLPSVHGGEWNHQYPCTNQTFSHQSSWKMASSAAALVCEDAAAPVRGSSTKHACLTML